MYLIVKKDAQEQKAVPGKTPKPRKPKHEKSKVKAARTAQTFLTQVLHFLTH